MANKKCMPLITNYKSDDSSLDDDDDDADDDNEIFNSFTVNSINEATDEDDQPLSHFRSVHTTKNDFLKNYPTILQQSVTNNSSVNTLKKKSQLILSSSNVDDADADADDSIVPNISDSDESNDSFSSGTDDEEFQNLVNNSAALPVIELLRSKQLTLMYGEKNRHKVKSDRIINIGYSQFFQEIQSVLKYEHPNASFHDLCRLVDERWNQLSKMQKKEYKKHSNLSKQSKQMTTSLAKCRSKLLRLLNENNKQCCNPTCRNPVAYDPRWNGQYCSTKCVGEHCQLTFIDWCNNKRYDDGKILKNTLFTVQRIPVINSDEANVNDDVKSVDHQNGNTCNIGSGSSSSTSADSSIMATNTTTATTTTDYNSSATSNTTHTTTSNTTTNNNNNKNPPLLDSSDCVSVSLKRKPLFESFKAEQFHNKSI
ncbi:unnamed protein product [Schistosoma turkestanicum]|nr:unnamed protein product [Schistosoma turkestanicum]